MKRNIIPYDDYNSVIPPPEKRQYIGTITQMCSRMAWRAAWKIIEIYET